MSHKTKIRQVTQRLRHIFPLVLVVVGLLAVFVVGTLSFKGVTRGNLQSSNGTSTQLQGEFKTFTSPNLGISFDYATGPNDQRVLVKQIGNKVYLYIDYTKKGDPTTGKFVEVFSKNPGDSLTEAVKKEFLQGYSSESCPIVPANLAKNTLNPARQYVQITVPVVSDGSMSKKLAEEKLCPPTYTYNRRTGLTYFMMDSSHPDKFVFFKIGQDNIWGAAPSSTGFGLTWDQTLQFASN